MYCHCPNCNVLNDNEAIFCTSCGTRLTSKPSDYDQSSRQTQNSQTQNSQTQNSQTQNSQTQNSQTQNAQSQYAREQYSQVQSVPVQNYYNQNENGTGYRQTTLPRDEYISGRSRGVAAVLCFWLGFLGIHRFYAGKVGTGLLWMITLGLFGFGTVSDFIMIVCGSFRDGRGYMIK